jgi:lipopolysaccharide export system permease protein
MRLLDRYLFRELLSPLAYCLGAILTLGVFGTLFNQLDEFQERKLHLFDIVEYSVAITPSFLVTTLPVILLLAMLWALTDHARANEITAMRAAGVSLWRVCAPYFIVGIAASLALFALNEIVVPRSTDWSWQIRTRYVHKSNDPDAQSEYRDFAFKNARENRTWFMGEYRVNTAEIIKPQVTRTLPDGSTQILRADHAVRIHGVWTFFNAEEYAQANSTAPLVKSLQTNALAMPEFDETPSQIRTEIKISGAFSLGLAPSADIPLKDIFGYLRLDPNLPRASSGPLLTELHGRIAAPWTCLVVVFIAIPFGVASGRRNLFVGVAGSIAICFIYFVIQKFSLAFGSGGALPAWLAAWLPNLIFGATGLFLMSRVR